MRTCLAILVAFLGALARADVPSGTPIRLMVLRDVGSDTSYPGDIVPCVVTEDVLVDGRLAVAEGTMAFAKVISSRREGALSASLFDKPARLVIVFEHMRDIDGDALELVAKPGGSGELQVTRELTVGSTPAEFREIKIAWEDSSTRPVMQKIRRLFADQAAQLTQKEAETLIAHNVRLPFVQDAIRHGLYGQVSGLIRDLKRGRVVEAFLSVSQATRPALVAVRAVRELGRLSGGIGNYFGGRFKGRNIRCSAGVQLTVFVR